MGKHVKCSADYHDYVFKDGEFIGKFEEMYQNVEDPWHQDDTSEIHYDMALYLLNRYDVCRSRGGVVLDIGCGLGSFTAKLRKGLNKDTRIIGIDIAPTAIQKAKEKYGDLGIDFIVCDIKKELKRLPLTSSKADLIIMSELMWYVLPSFRDICHGIKRYLEDEGYLIINQTFYPPEKQKYGKEIVSNVKDIFKLVSLPLIEMIETNRLKNHHAICLFKKD